MGFYGKIYEQMGDVFNRVGFVNANPGTQKFNTKALENFVLDAESHGDKLPFLLGNSWLQFVQGVDDYGNPTCIIYHSSAQGVAKNNIAALITEIIPGDDYNRLISAESTLLTDAEKELLQKARATGKFLYFGDKIRFATPQKDEAGHINGYIEDTYEIGAIPRLENILDSAADIYELQAVVGPDEYEADFPLTTRMTVLEADFTLVKKIANEANELANTSAENAAAAEKQAVAAAKSAEEASMDATQALVDLTSYQKDVNEKFTMVDGQIVGVYGALGLTNNEPIKQYMGDALSEPTFLAWNKYIDTNLDVLYGIIGEVPNDITLQEEIENNSADIEQLSINLNAEVQKRVAADNELTAQITSNVNTINTTISQTKTELEQKITDETNRATGIETSLRSDLSSEIARASGVENGLRTDLTSETTRATTVENNLTKSVTEETARAIAAEKVLTDNLALVTQDLAKLNGNETVIGSISYFIKQETEARIEADVNLSSLIGSEKPENEVSVTAWIASLVTLVESMQTTINELQEKIAVLESQT